MRRILELQGLRSSVRLSDGRVGRIVRVDTIFPANKTEVSVYTRGEEGPGIAKVDLENLTGVLESA